MNLTKEGREVDAAKSARFVQENLRQIVLLILIEKPTNAHGIVDMIFCKHAVLVNSNKVDSLLKSLGDEGMVAKTKEGLATVYSLTEQAKAAVTRKSSKTSP